MDELLFWGVFFSVVAAAAAGAAGGGGACGACGGGRAFGSGEGKGLLEVFKRYFTQWFWRFAKLFGLLLVVPARANTI